MKKFKWVYTQMLGAKTHQLSILEVEDSVARFWGILLPINDGTYKIILLRKNRDGYRTVEGTLDLDEAKLSVEKKLMDDEIIDDGDELEDYTI